MATSCKLPSSRALLSLSLSLSLSLFLLLPVDPAAARALPSLHAAAVPRHASTVCEFSVRPQSCRASLVSFPPRESAGHYGRFSLEQSLERAAWTGDLLAQRNDHHFGKKQGDWLKASLGVVEDCRELAGLNLHYLTEAQDELRLQMVDPSSLRRTRIKALMTAVTTNQQTCYDALHESSGIHASLTEAVGKGFRLYSASYELVADALDGVVEGSDFGEQFEFGSESGIFSGEQNIPQTPPVTVSTETPDEPLHVLKNLRVNEVVVVAKDGTGNFTSINEAVEHAPNNTIVGGGYFAIHIKGGVYQENVLVSQNKRNLIMIGDGINKTIITGSRYNGLGNWTTYSCATFAVEGDHFIATGITFENTAGPQNHQAVAVRNTGDYSAFYRCSFLGYQDTLYTQNFNQFYRECDIYGTIDFIFGNAAAVFQNCNIYVRRGLPQQINVITAQSRTNGTQMTGISMHQCAIRASPELEPYLNSTKTYLGRPWKLYSRTVYMQSSIDRLIDPAGWLPWDLTIQENHDSLYYGECDNNGEGANTANRVKWPGYRVMTREDASNFTVQELLSGNDWLPPTSIPYFADLE